MASINIPSYHDDPNYRYKMPKLRAKVEGRGNGIRTNIMNMGDISKSLKRPPEYTTKFFGCELGTQSKYDLTQGSAIVNGQHDEGALQCLVDKFIEKFVLCTNCQLPEMDLLISDSLVCGKCNACGHASELDNVHKLATFIVKNPKAGVESTVGGKTGAAVAATAAGIKKRTKEDRQREKADRARRKAAGEEMEEDADEERKAEKKAERKAERKAEKKAEKKAKKKLERQKAEDNNEGSDSSEDGTEEKVGEVTGNKKPSKKSTSGTTVVVCQNENLALDSQELDEVISRLRGLVLSEVPPKQLAEELHALQASQLLDPTAKLYCGLKALFSDAISPDNIDNKLQYIEQVCDRAVGPVAICTALEELIHRNYPNAWGCYPILLERLYHAELLEEEEILDYYAPEGRGSKAAMRRQDETPSDAYIAAIAAGRPFFQWLMEDGGSREEEG